MSEGQLTFAVSEAKVAALYREFTRLGIDESELEESFIRGGGSGGQKVNKTSSAVRLLHRPTKIEVRVESTRSQSLNRFLARRMLAEKIANKLHGEKTKEERKQGQLKKQKNRRKRKRRNKSQE